MRLAATLILASISTAAISEAASSRLTDDRKTVVAIDGNAPINEANGDIIAVPEVLAETETPVVRVNFILGPWTSPEDTTPRGSQQLSWFDTYDQIVNGYIAEGVEVYGLINSQALRSTHSLNTSEWTDDYTDTFETIVDHFKDRVRVYESFNEPNNWAPGTSAATLSSYYFAMSLEKIYRRIKIDNGHLNDPSWNDIQLISGPLFTHDIGGTLNSGGDTGRFYLNEVYQAGINQLGWTSMRNQYGTYPLDGIGFHIYVQTDTTDQESILDRMQYNLNECWQTVTAYEGADTQKQFWISEFGWRDDSTGSEANQAKNMTTSYDMHFRDSRVKLATWFCHTDFPEAPVNARWGIYRLGNFSEGDRKEAWYRFREISRLNDSANNIWLQMEDYDTFSDQESANQGGAYRNGGVDIEDCALGGFNVGWIYADEWLEFQNVEGTGEIYSVTARVASESQPMNFRIELDGGPVLEAINLPTTGGWQEWRTVDLGQVVIPDGDHDIRITMTGEGFNIDWIHFAASGEQPPAGTPETWDVF